MNSGLSPLATVLYESLLSNHDGISMPTWMSTCFLFDLASIPLMSFLKWLQTPTRKIKRRLKNAQQWSNRRLETLTILEKYLTAQLLHIKGSEHILLFLEEKVDYPSPGKYWALKLCIVSVCITILYRASEITKQLHKQQQKKLHYLSLPWITEVWQNNVKEVESQSTNEKNNQLTYFLIYGARQVLHLLKILWSLTHLLLLIIRVLR